MILAFSLIYGALILLLGFIKRGKGTSDYFVLGRAMTLPAFIASLVSTWYGGILGIGEYTYRYGISNWLVFGVPYYIAALVFALLLARKARRSEYYTIPDLLHKSFGKSVSVLGAIVVFFMTVPGAYVLMLGVLIHTVLGYSLKTGVIAGTLFSIVYVYRGGLRSVVRTDLIQFVFMYVSFTVVLIYLWKNFGGFHTLVAGLPNEHLTWHGGSSPQYVFVWYVIALATLVEPAFYQRCFAAKNEKTARNGILVSILFWMTFDFLTTATGLYVRAIVPDIADPMNSFPTLAVKILPPLLGALFMLGLLSTVMSTIDSYAFLCAITVGRDIVWRIRGGDDDESKRFSGPALVLTGAVAVIFALSFKSVVDIWHHFGSVGTPALLFPIASSLHGKALIRPREAMAMIIVGGGSSLCWILSPHFISSLQGRYPLNMEPIFPGMLLSSIIFAFALFRRRWEGRPSN